LEEKEFQLVAEVIDLILANHHDTKIKKEIRDKVRYLTKSSS